MIACIAYARAQESSAFPGEAFPQTRTRLLTAQEISRWSNNDIAHALVEMFARYGSPTAASQFRQFSWYHERPDLKPGQIDQTLFSDVERQNAQLLKGALRARGLLQGSGPAAGTNGPPVRNAGPVSSGSPTEPSVSGTDQTPQSFSWRQLVFPGVSYANPNPTKATTCLTYQLKSGSLLCLGLVRKDGETVFYLGTGQFSLSGNARDPNALREVSEMFDRAQDWANKVRANNISTLEKTIFTFTATHNTVSSFGVAYTNVVEPAQFNVHTEGGKRVIGVHLNGDWLEESEWPAYKFAVDHVKDLIPSYEERAIRIEQDVAGQKKKEDDLFKP